MLLSRLRLSTPISRSLKRGYADRGRTPARLDCVSELIAIVTMHPPQSAAPDPAAKGLKRTLTNGGLYPQPAGAAGKGKLQTRPSGSMAVFTEGGSALGGAESGAHNSQH